MKWKTIATTATAALLAIAVSGCASTTLTDSTMTKVTIKQKQHTLGAFLGEGDKNQELSCLPPGKLDQTKTGGKNWWRSTRLLLTKMCEH